MVVWVAGHRCQGWVVQGVVVDGGGGVVVGVGGGGVAVRRCWWWWPLSQVMVALSTLMVQVVVTVTHQTCLVQ